MRERSEQLDRILKLFSTKKVQSLKGIAEHLGVGSRMVQLYLKELSVLTSYTHSRQFITLSVTPKFNKYGIWFYRQVGFSEFGTSLNTIIGLIEQSKEGLSKNELEEKLGIKISQQIQTLMERDKLHRVKLGNRYLYLPKAAVKNRKRRLKLVGDRQTEEYFEKSVQKTDLVALLKAVLVDRKLGTSKESIKRIARKYSLRLPLQKIQILLVKYDLPEKKMQ